MWTIASEIMSINESTGAIALGKNTAITGTLAVSSTLAVTGATTATGALTATGGVVPPGTAKTTWHTGEQPAITATQGTELVNVVTEVYIAEVFVPHNCTLTGVSVLNATAVAGNIIVALYNSAGTVVANSALAGTAASGTAAYQQVPFTATYAAVGPAKYFVSVTGNNTGYKLRTLIVGNTGASKKTAEVFGTLTAITPPTTFTTGLGPVATTY